MDYNRGPRKSGSSPLVETVFIGDSFIVVKFSVCSNRYELLDIDKIDLLKKEMANTALLTDIFSTTPEVEMVN